jgi:uncharacterized membrane protein
MNDAHLHLVVNHFPIIGTIFGFGILVAGLLLKNNSVKNTAYVLFIIAAVFGFLSITTGEGAEEMVEDFPGIGKAIIHEHEEVAEKLALVLYALALTSVFGIYTNLKNKTKANVVSYIALGIALIAVYFAQQTGTTGGEIRHTEIRNDSAVSPIGNTDTSVEKEKDKD